jgi:hypothetical protein
MTVPARVNHHNSNCDRCGCYDSIPRGYGFDDIGYNLCRVCQEKWEKLIRNKISKICQNPEAWHTYANKLLKQFVKDTEKIKVEFT